MSTIAVQVVENEDTVLESKLSSSETDHPIENKVFKQPKPPNRTLISDFIIVKDVN